MFGSLVVLPCVSLTIAVFNSYPELFIVKLLIGSTRLSYFPSFSLVNIAFEFLSVNWKHD